MFLSASIGNFHGFHRNTSVTRIVPKTNQTLRITSNSYTYFNMKLKSYSSGIFLNEFCGPGRPYWSMEPVGDTLACWTELTLSLLGLGLRRIWDMTLPKNGIFLRLPGSPSSSGGTCIMGPGGAATCCGDDSKRGVVCVLVCGFGALDTLIGPS